MTLTHKTYVTVHSSDFSDFTVQSIDKVEALTKVHVNTNTATHVLHNLNYGSLRQRIEVVLSYKKQSSLLTWRCSTCFFKKEPCSNNIRHLQRVQAWSVMLINTETRRKNHEQYMLTLLICRSLLPTENKKLTIGNLWFWDLTYICSLAEPNAFHWPILTSFVFRDKILFQFDAAIG